MRVNSAERIRVCVGLTVVPPFEIAWLSDPDSKLSGEKGCIVFEVRGETDATVVLTTKPGSRRWQHCAEANGAAEDYYIVIFGSHRNSLLGIERNGEKKAAVRENWTTICPDHFSRFWICYMHGGFCVGRGDPSDPSECQYKWRDPDPLTGIQCVGLSAWDKHITFRNVCVEPIVPWRVPCCAFPSLMDISTRCLFDNLTMHTACRVMLVLDNLELPSLTQIRKKAVSILARDFKMFVEECHSVFWRLSSGALSLLLRSPELSSDEQAVYDSVVAWMFHGQHDEHKMPCRTSLEIKEVVKWIRFATVEKDQLQAMLSQAQSVGSAELCEAIVEALVLQSVASEGNDGVLSIQSSEEKRQILQCQPELDKYWRRDVGCGKQLQYLYDGDKNGVVSFMAHDCGRGQWMNPMSTRKLRIKASSPQNRLTNPKSIVGGRFSSTNFTCPKKTEGESATWWMIDLLDYVLICNYYTIRHDASRDFVRCWDFQASNDDESWITLRKHINDRTINAPGAYGSWPIFCNAKPYRMFRLLLTGPTESQIARYNMALSSLELYGTLIGPGV